MKFLILLGLFALVFGKIRITGKLSLSGKAAKFYGLALIVLAYPVSILLGKFLGEPITSLLPDPRLGTLVNLAIVLGFAGLLIVPFRKMNFEERERPKAPSLENLERRPKMVALVSISSFLVAAGGMTAVMELNPGPSPGSPPIWFTGVVLIAGLSMMVFIISLYILAKSLFLRKFRPRF